MKYITLYALLCFSLITTCMEDEKDDPREWRPYHAPQTTNHVQTRQFLHQITSRLDRANSKSHQLHEDMQSISTQLATLKNTLEENQANADFHGNSLGQVLTSQYMLLAQMLTEQQAQREKDDQTNHAFFTLLNSHNLLLEEQNKNLQQIIAMMHRQQKNDGLVDCEETTI